MKRKQKTAIIIGAGPAGLTAAYELLTKTDITPIVLEMSDEIGGISRTVNYKGNRIDIGGHRFFSKSARVMRWWQDILPVEDIEKPDRKQPKRMLIRNRLSRIYFLRRFFDYPISLSKQTLKNLGITRIARIGITYLQTRLSPIKNEKSLEDFFINRFGTELYKTFFRDYTAKVWGVPCSMIKSEWGAQRIKGISVTRIVKHAMMKPFKRESGIDQKKTETSLISRFLYPKYGPGQMWEEVARLVQQKGGTVLKTRKVIEVHADSENKRITKVLALDTATGKTETYCGEYFFSTMPIKDLVSAWHGKMPPEIKSAGTGLQYRDFLTVGLLLKQLKIEAAEQKPLRDNWIYIQEPEVKVGRLQIFNNWSPYLVNDPNTYWIGLEYFCNEGDDIWAKSDTEMKQFAAEELERIDIIDRADVIDAVVIKTPKAYPAYFGTYDRLGEVKDFLADYANLFLIGRNGMHRYNNQDHSMLSAMAAVENIIQGNPDNANIWEINTELEYHETRQRTEKKVGKKRLKNK